LIGLTGFRQINPENINDNTFKLIGHDWMLVASGTQDKFNMMTASWGGFGVLWNKNVCYIFIRPTRYTFEFLEQNDTFTLNFFGREWRKALNICGTKSGRDIDKAKETGLTPIKCNNTVGFEQARMIMECKKLYFQDINPENFLDPSLISHYSKKDYHRLYVGEILSVNIKE